MMHASVDVSETHSCKSFLLESLKYSGISEATVHCLWVSKKFLEFV